MRVNKNMNEVVMMAEKSSVYNADNIVLLAFDLVLCLLLQDHFPFPFGSHIIHKSSQEESKNSLMQHWIRQGMGWVTPDRFRTRTTELRSKASATASGPPRKLNSKPAEQWKSVAASSSPAWGESGSAVVPHRGRDGASTEMEWLEPPRGISGLDFCPGD